MTQQKLSPNFEALLSEAISSPGLVHSSYRAFKNYSLGNRAWITSQMRQRDLPIEPVSTFKDWESKGRKIKKGEKALWMLMPVSYVKKGQESLPESEREPGVFFAAKPRWFSISQTEGQELPELDSKGTIGAIDESSLLSQLDIAKVPFDSLDGNIQGWASKRTIAINPLAAMPEKTLFHEIAHVLLGHTEEGTFSHDEKTPKNLMEVEAESVAYLVLASLNVPGLEYPRGYIQGWLGNGESIPEKSAKKIMNVADKILKTIERKN